MDLNPHVFRAYDVRGLVGSHINPEVFRHVGRAYGTLIRRNGGRTVAVGQDNRDSSAALKAGFLEGVRGAGLDVVDVGLVTTPMLYFATAHWRLDGGANVTGSHNPVDYNGVKMVHAGAAPLTEDEIQDLRRRPTGSLAYGLQKRVELGRAALRPPDRVVDVLHRRRVPGDRRLAEVERDHDHAALGERLVQDRVVRAVAAAPGAAVQVDDQRERTAAARREDAGE